MVKRCLIVLFWVALIFSFLYFPTWNTLGRTEKKLNIFSWGDILDPAVIAEFEKQSGIKVQLNYYSSNEELLVKLKATHGFGYDLIIPSDYAVKLLAEEKLLQEIDKTRLDFWNRLNPSLLNHPFDPDNQYSIPFEWEIYGLGFDKGFFKELNPSWDLIFKPQEKPYKIAMLNDPIEAVAVSAFYLYGSVDTLNKIQEDAIKKLLMTQKKWVEAYANFRGDYFLATKNCPVVVASSSYIRRTMKQFPFVGFAVPKEGTFISIENICIPKTTQKQRMVYKLINFLFEPSSIKSHYDTFGFFPALVHELDELEKEDQFKDLIASTPEEFAQYHFIRPLLSQQEINDLWIEIKTVKN